MQEALSHLLGDPNELTQDLASQGMSIVYELGDASMKEELVHALVNTLTGAARKKKAIKVHNFLNYIFFSLDDNASPKGNYVLCTCIS